MHMKIGIKYSGKMRLSELEEPVKFLFFPFG